VFTVLSRGGKKEGKRKLLIPGRGKRRTPKISYSSEGGKGKENRYPCPFMSRPLRVRKTGGRRWPTTFRGGKWKGRGKGKSSSAGKKRHQGPRARSGGQKVSYPYFTGRGGKKEGGREGGTSNALRRKNPTDLHFQGSLWPGKSQASYFLKRRGIGKRKREETPAERVINTSYQKRKTAYLIHFFQEGREKKKKKGTHSFPDGRKRGGENAFLSCLVLENGRWGYLTLCRGEKGEEKKMGETSQPGRACCSFSYEKKEKGSWPYFLTSGKGRPISRRKKGTSCVILQLMERPGGVGSIFEGGAEWGKITLSGRKNEERKRKGEVSF